MGALKVWDSVAAAWKFVGNVLTVRDESNSQSEPATTDLRFPDGTVRAQGSGVVSIREVPTGVIGAKAYHSTTQSVGTGAWAVLSLNSEVWDTDGFHSTVTNTSRMTIPAGLGGQYLVLGQTEATAAATGQRSLGLYINGAHATQQTPYPNALGSSSYGWRLSYSAIVTLNGGDYVELVGYQDSGGSINFGHASFDGQRTAMSIYKLGSGNIGETIGAIITEATAQSLTNDTPTALTSNDAEILDSDGFHDTGSNTARLTIPTGLSGKYLVTGTVFFAANATGYRQASIYKGGADQSIQQRSTSVSGSVGTYVSIAQVFALTAGEYIELYASQTSGGALNGTMIRFAAILLATTGMPRGYRDGTAFPSGPATNDKFYRTDLNLLFVYDGTRWLSAELFHYVMSPNTNTVLPVSTTPANLLRAVVPHGSLSLYLVEWSYLIRVNTTNNGTNFWTIKLQKYDGTTADDIDSFTTAAMTAGNITRTRRALTTVSDTSEILFQTQEAKTLSPGTIDVAYCTVSYRIIAT